VGIPRGERIIAWGVGSASDPDASLVVATSSALYEQRTGQRIEWQQVAKGTWEQPEFVIDFEDSGALRRIRIRIDDARDLPAAVRDRVTDTVVISEHRNLVGEQGAQFVARRTPDGDLEDIQWSVVFDSGLDPTDPTLRQRADAELAALRASLGV
jgi:hypothetical protein